MDRFLGLFLVGLFTFFTIIVYFAHTSMYNEAMVRCLDRHSRDVCVETLR